LLARVERAVARQLGVRDCQLRLHAIGRCSQHLERADLQVWEHMVSERQQIIEELERLGVADPADAELLSQATQADDARLQAAVDQARRTAEGNASLLTEVMDLDAGVQQTLKEHLAALSEALAEPARRQQVQTAYGSDSSPAPRFLDRRR
jgi:hypothetical protein